MNEIKGEERGEHIDSSGRLPTRSGHTPKEYIDSIRSWQRSTHLMNVEYHNFFLFGILKYASYVFPQTYRIFTSPVRQKLYVIEKRIKPLWSAISIRIVVSLKQQKE